jgi:cytochrome c-type biogenesis protein CcmH
MTVFLIAAALMLATALCFVLPTLLRKERSGATHTQRDALNLEVLRDQLRELDADRAAGTLDNDGYDSSRHDLERRVAEDVHQGTPMATMAPGKPWLATALGTFMVACAIALYVLLGHPAGLDPARFAQDNPQPTVTPEQIAGMVDKLARHLKEKPDDAEGWAMLARSCYALGRYDEAADAYSHLVKLMPPEAGMLADYADALAMSTNKSLQGEPDKLITQALQLDPKNVKALALSGAASYERRDYAAAAAQWKKILALVPPDSEMAGPLAKSIAEAQNRANPSNAAPPGEATAAPTTTAATSSATAAAQISGTVELDPALRAQAADSDTVFIFARAVDGPRFPLAVLRKQVKDLPAAFALDDSMSMMPNAKLSGFPNVIVGARISKSGSATPSPGDLEGSSEPLHLGAKNVKIRIDAVRK